MKTKDKTVIVYHTDIDGYGSGAILQHYLKQKNPIMIRMNYDDEFDWSLIDENTEVWMADFALQPWSNMIRLNRECKQLVWIDHHKTSIAEYTKWIKTTKRPLKGLRIDGTAACALCWRFTHEGMDPPRPIYLAAEYDVWRWQNTEGSIEFQYGTKFYETDPATEEGNLFWEDLLYGGKTDQITDRIIEEGKLLMKYKKLANYGYIKDNYFETEIHNLKVIAVNRKGNSQQFDAVWDPEKYDAMLTFSWGKGMWTVSLYTDKPGTDVSVVAKHYGGGGHAGACGFQCSELPFELR